VGTDFAQANKKEITIHENIVVFCFGTPTYNRIDDDGFKAYTDKRTKKMSSELGAKGLTKRIPFENKTTRAPTTIRTFFPDNRKGLGSSLHPTQKPVALYEYLIKTYTNEGETVLDIAMGSGTTIEAAERTGRNSIGIEKDEGIFQSAVLRLKSFTPSNNRLHLTGGGLPATQSSFTAEGIPPAKLPAKSPRR